MKHLSPEQISKVVSAIGAVEEELHGRECPLCAAEVEKAHEVLTMFRSSVREWSEVQSHSEIPTVVPVVRSPRRLHIQAMAWALAAVMLLAVAVPVYQNSRERQVKAQAELDVLLIEKVNAQLSRSAPVAMSPLMQLMLVPDNGIESTPVKRTNLKKSGNERGVQ